MSVSSTAVTTQVVQSQSDFKQDRNAPEVLQVTLRRRPERIRRTVKQADGGLYVEWSEDTVDNEDMNKKKSNKCCIFKKKREFGESSDESEWEEQNGEGKWRGKEPREDREYKHDDDHDGHECGGSHHHHHHH